MPPCPFGCGQRCVHFHGWRTNNWGRRVCRLSDHYFVISRRYKCTECQEAVTADVEAAKSIAEHAGLTFSSRAAANECDSVEVELQHLDNPVNEIAARIFPAPRRTYTFMGFNAQSRQQLPHGLGDLFPAFVTWRGGVDKVIVDMMRPLIDSGTGFDSIHNLMLELHAKRYHETLLRRENEWARLTALGAVDYFGNSLSLFSHFSDPRKWVGRVPTAQYLSNVYALYHDSIRHHLDLEVGFILCLCGR